VDRVCLSCGSASGWHVRVRLLGRLPRRFVTCARTHEHTNRDTRTHTLLHVCLCVRVCGYEFEDTSADAYI